MTIDTKTSRHRRSLVVTGSLLVIMTAAGVAVAAQGDTTRVSVSSNGNQGNNISAKPAISADGRYTTFQSDASNLVAGDSNGFSDVFVHDSQTGNTTRVSVSSIGSQADNSSFQPDISADGRYITFHSAASNLVAGDSNGFSDIFVHDLQNGNTTRVSVDSFGNQSNNHSSDPAISGDGRFVTFYSTASNLVAGDSNGFTDVFVHDRHAGNTTRVSVSSTSNQSNGNSVSPEISADGRYVTFYSEGSNVVVGDSNGFLDVFLHDRQTGETTRVSISNTGSQGNGNSVDPTISDDGRYVTFSSFASNLVAGDTNAIYDVFIHDSQTGTMTRVSVSSTGIQGNSGSSFPAITGDGRYVAHDSGASNLVAGDTNGSTDVFVHQFLPDPPPVVLNEGVGVVDQSTGVWTLRKPDSSMFSFFYGNPGDVPFMGDWDCDGIDTPGLYRQSDGFVYLRNSNSQGVADIRFFFGNPGDLPLAGDFNGNGCDTVSIYRSSEARWYIINALGANDGGLGAADFSYLYGDIGDVPFVGDWNNDGIDTPGLRRFSNGFVYIRNTNSQGNADQSWFYGDDGDHVFTGDYNGDGIDSIGLFRPSNTTIYLRNDLSTGIADTDFQLGTPNSKPVAGKLD